MKVLIVDPSAQVRLRFAELVQESVGVDVATSAPCSEDLGQCIRRFAPDVVVVSVQVAGVAGPNLIREIKEADDRAVVVALSSPSSLLHRVMCHRAGATFFFDKIAEQDRLVEAITAINLELAV